MKANVKRLSRSPLRVLGALLAVLAAYALLFLCLVAFLVILDALGIPWFPAQN